MNNYRASYNFPPVFLWGLNAGKDFLPDRIKDAYLFQLKDHGIKSFVIRINWAEYEPGRNQYDEKLIEATRNLLSKIKTRNIEPVIILGTDEIPQWQNLDEKPKDHFFPAEKFNFATHLANAFISYAKYFGIVFPGSALYSKKQMQESAEIFNDVREYIHSLSDAAKTGTVFYSSDFFAKNTGLRQLLARNQMNILRSIESDFRGIPADEPSIAGFEQLFDDKRIPILFLTDLLKQTPDFDRGDRLIDILFHVWQLYQRGWPVLGYHSDLDHYSESVESILYSSYCRNNALEITTEDPYLPEKWVQFLKN